MKRLEGWEVRYHAFLTARLREPFVWSQNDCCTFAAAGIQAITGIEIDREFRGLYDSGPRGFAMIRKVTGGDGVAAMIDYVAARYGLHSIAPLMAKRGDVVLIEDTDREIAGLVGMCGNCMSPGDEGLRRQPIDAARAAWTYEI